MLRRHSVLFFLSATLLSDFLLAFFPTIHQPLFEESGQMRDFAFHLANVSGFWLHHTGSIYTPEAILRSLSAVLGLTPPPGVSPMPNPFSPSILLIWAPLLIPLQFSIEVAFCSWLAISFGIILTLTRQLWLEAVPPQHISRVWFTLGALAILTSPVSRTCFDIGQTSLFALGISGLLIRQLLREKWHPRDDRRGAMLLFLLSLKAPYFAIGTALLVMERRWRALGAGITITVAGMLLTEPFGTGHLMKHFLETLSRYSTQHAGSGGFYWGEFGSHTPTWLNSSAGLIPDDTRLFINSCAIGLGGLLYGTLFLKSARFDRQLRLTITTSLVVGVYLCFSPYLGFYDQLLIVLPVFAALQPASLDSRTLAFAVIGSLSFSLSSFQPLVAVFAQKLLFLLSLAGYFVHRSKNRTPILPSLPTKEKTGPVIDFSSHSAADIHDKETR